MFRHKDKSRTLQQNLRIASLLAFVAGIVNVVGFLSVQTLTTNVTGHFTFMVDEALRINLRQALFYFLYIFSFLFGSFFSNFVIEITNKISNKYVFVIPVLTEACILCIIGVLDYRLILAHPNNIACLLLFVMGLQNSLVTTISNAVVRTTHLTGLFTDLGIEISQLFFFRSETSHQKLMGSIKLRLTIISTFFLGGIFAGLLFSYIQMYTLLFASLALLIALVSDYLSTMLRFRKLKILRYGK